MRKKTSTICSKVQSHSSSSHREIKRGSVTDKHFELPPSNSNDQDSNEPLNSFHKPPMIHTHVDYNRLLEEERRRIQEEE